MVEASEAKPLVFEDFKRLLNPSVAIPVSAFHALTEVIKRSKSNTMMGLEIELRSAAEELKQCAEREFLFNTSISLTAGCELFLRYVTRTSLDFSEDFTSCKEELIKRGEQFSLLSMKSRIKIAQLSKTFIRDGSRVLTHGCSRVVNEILLSAAETKHFSVYVTEGRADCSGYDSARILNEKGIPVTMLLDSAIGYIMDQIDIIIVGAEGVVENGGIVNKIGTFQLAIIAAAHKKPFYVATESYKFTRLFPLTQSDLPLIDVKAPIVPCNNKELPPAIKYANPTSDYTPPSYITLIFTDLGVLTPSAVSDELIKLYQ